jgi:hypothetical protein
MNPENLRDHTGEGLSWAFHGKNGLLKNLNYNHMKSTLAFHYKASYSSEQKEYAFVLQNAFSSNTMRGLPINRKVSNLKSNIKMKSKYMPCVFRIWPFFQDEILHLILLIFLSGTEKEINLEELTISQIHQAFSEGNIQLRNWFRPTWTELIHLTVP